MTAEKRVPRIVLYVLIIFILFISLTPTGTIDLLFNRKKYDEIVEMMASDGVQRIDGDYLITKNGFKSCTGPLSGSCLILGKVRNSGIQSVFYSERHRGIVILFKNTGEIFPSWGKEKAYLCDETKKMGINGCWRAINYSSFF